MGRFEPILVLLVARLSTLRTGELSTGREMRFHFACRVASVVRYLLHTTQFSNWNYVLNSRSYFKKYCMCNITLYNRHCSFYFLHFPRYPRRKSLEKIVSHLVHFKKLLTFLIKIKKYIYINFYFY